MQMPDFIRERPRLWAAIVLVCSLVSSDIVVSEVWQTMSSEPFLPALRVLLHPYAESILRLAGILLLVAIAGFGVVVLPMRAAFTSRLRTGEGALELALTFKDGTHHVGPIFIADVQGRLGR